MPPSHCCLSLFFFTDPATTEIYTLSLHDALPISNRCATMSPATVTSSVSCSDSQVSTSGRSSTNRWSSTSQVGQSEPCGEDRKSTRLNSSHVAISYAVFCLKKKKKNMTSRRDAET